LLIDITDIVSNSYRGSRFKAIDSLILQGAHIRLRNVLTLKSLGPGTSFISESQHAMEGHIEHLEQIVPRMFAFPHTLPARWAVVRGRNSNFLAMENVSMDMDRSALLKKSESALISHPLPAPNNGGACRPKRIDPSPVLSKSRRLAPLSRIPLPDPPKVQKGANLSWEVANSARSSKGSTPTRHATPPTRLESVLSCPSKSPWKKASFSPISLSNSDALSPVPSISALTLSDACDLEVQQVLERASQKVESPLLQVINSNPTILGSHASSSSIPIVHCTDQIEDPMLGPSPCPSQSTSELGHSATPELLMPLKSVLQPRTNSPQLEVAMAAEQDDDDSVELIFDTKLGCYMDPATGKYYNLVA
jgi:hypothetical protein